MFTKLVIRAAGFKIVEWPPYFPNLSPIKTLWDNIKDYIQEYYPNVYRSYKRLKAVIQEAWESITFERIRELIRTIRERCQAIIDADGWQTKW